jgi:hypothetical protein
MRVLEENSFEMFEEQIHNNKFNWYPNNNGEVVIIENFDKTKIQELKQKATTLKDTDKILIFADNSLAVKNICENNKDSQNLFNKVELEELLNEIGLKYMKFYYPLPSSNNVNVIFTDKYLPDSESISRNIVFYENKEFIKNDERTVFSKLISLDKNWFKVFANSYIIECSKLEFEDNQIQFVSYSNMRKEEYRIKTIIKSENVFKTAVNDKSKEHINNIKKNIDLINSLGLKTLDSYDENNIISKYQKNNVTLDKFLIDLLKKDNKEQVKKIIQDFLGVLKDKLEVIDSTENNVFNKYEIEYKDEDIENLTFVKNGFWDAIFQNVFYIDNEFYFFDQEWFEENIPLEFILYRTIIYNKDLLNYFELNEMFKELNITSKNIELFKILDNKLQMNTRSEISWAFHNNSYNIGILDEKNKRIKFLEEEMTKTCNLLRQAEEELKAIKSSKYWKVKEKIKKLIK